MSVEDLKYKDYKDTCIDLLNKLVTPCPIPSEPPKDPETSPKSSPEKSPEPSPEPDKSSNVFNPNGQVGSLEELIVFLIKSPIQNHEISMKLNAVYKIFNPTARDIVSKKPESTPQPETLKPSPISPTSPIKPSDLVV